MKLSLNWLSEFVDLKNLKTEEVGEKLTIHTSELEEIISEKEFFQDVFAGKMLDTRSHKDSDKLSVATFDLGKNGKKQIIYAKKHEVKVGEILPISIAGAKLKSGIEINNSEIRGEKSEGMIADNEELGMKNEGLMFFTDKDVGKSLPEICTEFADSLFDIDNKSLTHRPDLMGHRGFALELSAIWKRKLTLPEPVVAIPQDANKIPVEIKTDTCRRFCALKMENVEVKPSDLKTQSRLENLDVRAISNFVDITNWVMLEFGQPMHVFDADKLEGRIIVRQAKKGETLVALDDEEYELDETMTVVADDKKVLSIAGIMGGKESGVTETTTNIIFEAANWDPTATRKTSQKLGLRSESSMRYEKSLDPENCKRAILAATELAEKSCPQAQITSSLTDEYPIKSTPTIIKFNPEIVRKISGIDISDKEIKENLEAVNFIVNEDWSVEVPSNRATKDVSIPEDLVEEIVRLYGFENIEGVLPTLPITPPQKNELRDLEWKVRDFCAAMGFLEVYNYSFASEIDQNFEPNKSHVEVQNPLSGDQKYLRTNLISNFVKNCESELRTHGKLDFFEFGNIFEKVDNQVLPNETKHLALFSAGMGNAENEDFFRLKAEISRVFELLEVKAEFRPCAEPKQYFHPSKSADIFIDGELVGEIATLHPQFTTIKNSFINFCEINAEKLLKSSQKSNILYQEISSFPSVYRDLSIVLNDRTLISDIEKVCFESATYLKKIELFDEFFDPIKLGKNLKNLAFHLSFKSDERTLNEQEIDENFNQIVKNLNSKFNAKLRLEFDKEKNS